MASSAWAGRGETPLRVARSDVNPFVGDTARIPTAIGVNPSLTISALALRTADKIIEELPPVS